MVVLNKYPGIAHKPMQDKKKADTEVEDPWREDLRRIADKMRDIFIERDLDGKYLYVNPSFERIFGYSCKDFIENDRIANKIFTKSEYFIFIDNFIRKDTNPQGKELETQALNDKGEPLNIRSKIFPSINPGGEVIGFYEILEDITELLTAQKAREEAEKQFHSLHINLMAKNKELDDFAYRVSHDMKNSFNIIRGFVAVIKEHPERFDRYFHHITREIDILTCFIDNLLKLSRTGRIIGKLSPLELEPLIRNACQYREEQNFPVELIFDTPLPPVKGDHDSLKQVFSNLIQNSLKFKDPSREKLIINVGFIHQGEESLLYIRDNGMGIEEKNLGRIFLPGFTTCEKGTGFGLAIVKKIVDAHGWEIYAESGGKGQGTGFYINIPDKQFGKDFITLPTSP